MNDGKQTLQVKMLGEFQIFWAGKEVQLKSRAATKSMQILQLLLYHAPQVISSESLSKQIFEYDDLLNPNNNLKASISQLRRQLSTMGFPCEEFIKYQKNGYKWSCPLPLEVDVHQFEQFVRQGEQAIGQSEQIQAYSRAVDCYTGNFLPKLIGIDWAVQLSAYYGNLFAETVRKLAQLLNRRGLYEETLLLGEQAYQIQRTEEWQILRIECLMELGRWEEAKQVYKDTVSVLSKEFDLPPSEALLKQYQEISEKISNAYGTFDDMLQNVRENECASGAYFCAYPGFIDSCRVIARNMMRTGLSCFLMLCSIGDREGNPLQNEERLNRASIRLYHSIQTALRRGDFFTQYNKNQFLIFLVGTCKENCDLVAQRVESRFQEDPVRGVHLFYEVISAAQDQDLLFPKENEANSPKNKGDTV